ncbi:mitochondrial prohibitin complex protein 2-like [Amphiura filiformis]|uniref:mitochondrial prohibitin complex protein 2-like n=1 Tax=Amphiura filiformis TaxID=82378 RepID=UPI003B219096
MSEHKGKIVLGGVVAVAVSIVIIIIVSIKTLASDQMAVMYNTVLRDLYSEVRQEGLHTGPPGFRFLIFPAVYRTISYENLRCLNEDGVIITLNIAFQYQVRDESLRDTVLQFRNHETFKRVLENAGESAIHEACSKYNTTEFQAKRQQFQTSVRELLSARYQALNTTIDDLQVNNIARPAEYEAAVRSKEAARENIQVAESERPRKKTEAETKLKEAETAAIIAINKANSEARIALTRAEAEAEGVFNEYVVEAETYIKIVQEQNLTTEGFLAYMGVRTVGLAHNPVYAGIDAPAKTAYLGP